MDPIAAALSTATSGLQAQSMRVRIVSENLANSDSTGLTASEDPYRRKTLVFGEELDRLTGASRVAVDRVSGDPTPFRTEFRPGHPAADARGYVKLPNVNPIVELADLRQASRSYEANLQVIRQTRDMISMTVDLLRAQG